MGRKMVYFCEKLFLKNVFFVLFFFFRLIIVVISLRLSTVFPLESPLVPSERYL